MEIVYGTASKVLELLASKAYQEISLAWGVRHELRKLWKTVSIIQAVLLDAEEKQSHNLQISVWLAELKDVLLDAEELLGEFECEELRKKVKLRGSSTRRKVSYFFSRSNPLVFCSSFGRKIKKVRNKLLEVAAKKKEFGLEERHERNQIISERRVTHSYVRASDVIGREDDRENIIHLLIEPCDKSNISVIPIRGLGGLGKTTLAKLVYNDERVQSHFGLKMWVCVSENFDVPRLIKEILSSATGIVNENMTFDQLQKGLRDELEAQKFLLILDDVWSESDSREKWIALKELLMVGSEGSKIIVTTRKQSVADVMGTISTYHLKGLPSKDCLSLFIKWAFKDGDDEQRHPNLVKIGAEIVEKCKGLPLAVTTLGSLLYSKLDEGDWKYIRDNEIWKLEQKEDDVLHALQLSYNELPSYLKQCFHYCSLFPKDYRFKSWELIPLWMAHGLLVQPDGHRNKSFEEIGELYFKQLWSRSFFQDVEYYDSEGYYMFSMHDLIHDLAQLMSKNECSTISSPTEIHERVRHLSITLCSCDEELACLDKLKSVHTIIVSAESHLSSPSFIEKYISKFKFLRGLDLSRSSFAVLPSDIGRMKHLRYLDLSFNRKIKELPSSICNLQSLQSLLLGGCTRLQGLPSDINCLINLRLLVITTLATSLPEMECLTSLNDLRLRWCPNLISLPKSVRCLTGLESLFILGCETLTLREDKDKDQVSKSRLRRLTIKHLPNLVALPQWLRGCEGTLQFFAVTNCPNFKELPQWLPKTASLLNFQITDCAELQSLPAEEMHLLSSLRKLTIVGCPKLINSIKAMRKEWLQRIDFRCDFDYEEDEEMDDSKAEAEGYEEIEQDFTVGPSLSKLEIGEYSGQS